VPFCEVKLIYLTLLYICDYSALSVDSCRIRLLLRHQLRRDLSEMTEHRLTASMMSAVVAGGAVCLSAHARFTLTYFLPLIVLRSVSEYGFHTSLGC